VIDIAAEYNKLSLEKISQTMVSAEDCVNHINTRAIKAHVNKGVVSFHHRRYKSLQEITLREVLKKKDLHFYRARKIWIASELVKSLLEDLVSSFDGTIFRQFLDDIALFIVSKEKWGTGSPSGEYEVEFDYQSNQYKVSVKMGQSKGNTRTTLLRGYDKVVGQDFWYSISGKETLYTDIIEPLGVRAREHNQHFLDERARIINVFTKQFTDDFCDDGRINWKRLVEFNSGPLKMPRIKTSRKK
jgi:hypothetical protein